MDENRHMVESFLDKKMPNETWYDGLEMVKLVQAMYMSAESGRRLDFPPDGLDEYIPAVARGVWKPVN